MQPHDEPGQKFAGVGHPRIVQASHRSLDEQRMVLLEENHRIRRRGHVNARIIPLHLEVVSPDAICAGKAVSCAARGDLQLDA